VYNPDRQRLRYLVEFDYEGDPPSDTVTAHAEGCARDGNANMLSITTPLSKAQPVDLNDILNCKIEQIQSGLQTDDPSADVPVQETHVRASLVDLAAEVTIFQQ
jgi:hypothetical protein